jgi:hypothetical protein
LSVFENKWLNLLFYYSHGFTAYVATLHRYSCYLCFTIDYGSQAMVHNLWFTAYDFAAYDFAAYDFAAYDFAAYDFAAYDLGLCRINV